MALRASSSGRTAATSSGRYSISSSARTAKTLNLARPMTRPRFLSRPRTWFSRSRLILTSKQVRPARQQCPNRMAVDILDAHLLEPAGLHDAGDPGSIIAVALIDLHFEYRLGVPSYGAI